MESQKSGGGRGRGETRFPACSPLLADCAFGLALIEELAAAASAELRCAELSSAQLSSPCVVIMMR